MTLECGRARALHRARSQQVVWPDRGRLGVDLDCVGTIANRTSEGGEGRSSLGTSRLEVHERGLICTTAVIHVTLERALKEQDVESGSG